MRRCPCTISFALNFTVPSSLPHVSFEFQLAFVLQILPSYLLEVLACRNILLFASLIITMSTKASLCSTPACSSNDTQVESSALPMNPTDTSPEDDEVFVVPDIQTFEPSETQPGSAETTVATFSSSSCSYLSPFSTNATFIVLGGDECDEDEIFITPKNLVQPEITVQSPTSLMPRIVESDSIPEKDLSSSKNKVGGVFSKLFKAANTITLAPVVSPTSSAQSTGPNPSQKLKPDPLVTPHEFRRFVNDSGKRYPSSPAPNIPPFDKIDIRNMARRDRSCSESDQMVVHQTGIIKSDSRKISLDLHSGRFCKQSDQGLMLKKRSYSVTESVAELEAKKDSGSKIWKQLKGTGFFNVGRVASVFSSLHARKNKTILESKQDCKSLCEYYRV